MHEWTYIHFVADLDRWSWGRWSVSEQLSTLQDQFTANTKPVYLNVKQAIFLHLHLVILQMLLSKMTYNWGIHKAIHLEEANRQRKCS